MSRSTKKSYINLIDYKPKVSTGCIYKITDDKGKIILVPQMITKRDGDNMSKQARICHCIGLLKIKELKISHLK